MKVPFRPGISLSVRKKLCVGTLTDPLNMVYILVNSPAELELILIKDGHC